MKRMMALFLAGILIFGCSGTAFAKDIAVQVDDKQVKFTDAKPFIDEKGRTMVPLRPVADAMGLEVEWGRRTKTAVFSETYQKGMEGFGYDINGKAVYGEITYMSLSFKVNDPKVEMLGKVKKENGEMTMIADHFQMDTTAVVKNGRTYAPLRYMVQSFGYDVSWDKETKTVVVENYRMQ